MTNKLKKISKDITNLVKEEIKTDNRKFKVKLIHETDDFEDFGYTTRVLHKKSIFRLQEGKFVADFRINLDKEDKVLISRYVNGEKEYSALYDSLTSELEEKYNIKISSQIFAAQEYLESGKLSQFY